MLSHLKTVTLLPQTGILFAASILLILYLPLGGVRAARRQLPHHHLHDPSLVPSNQMCAPKHASFINQTFPVVKTGCGWQGREQMCGAPEVHGDSWPQAGGTVHRVLLRPGRCHSRSIPSQWVGCHQLVAMPLPMV